MSKNTKTTIMTFKNSLETQAFLETKTRNELVSIAKANDVTVASKATKKSIVFALRDAFHPPKSTKKADASKEQAVKKVEKKADKPKRVTQSDEMRRIVREALASGDEHNRSTLGALVREMLGKPVQTSWLWQDFTDVPAAPKGEARGINTRSALASHMSRMLRELQRVPASVRGDFVKALVAKLDSPESGDEPVVNPVGRKRTGKRPSAKKATVKKRVAAVAA